MILVCDGERNPETDKDLCIDALQQAQNFKLRLIYTDFASTVFSFSSCSAA